MSEPTRRSETLETQNMETNRRSGAGPVPGAGLRRLLRMQETAIQDNKLILEFLHKRDAESASQAQDQIVLTDQAGREVVLEGPAQSIVSCYYISTYAAIALGAEDRVAGLEKKADTRPIYQMAAPELLEKPQVGTMKELDVEAVAAALEPELVIMPQALADYADTLAQLGIPVLVVNPESHEALVEMLQLMGTALGLEDRAEALTSYYQEQLDRMAELTQDTEAPVVYMGSNSSFLATAPASMYQSTLVRQAGGVNAGDSLEGDYWTEVSYEDVLAQHLAVMDSTATSLSMDNHIPVLVFALKDPENIIRAVEGEKIGTIVGEN